MVAKLKREGFVAVVLTCEYGGGYSTWVDYEQSLAALFDPVVVAAVDNMEDGLGTEGLTDYLWQTYRWDGRIENLSVEWVREGRPFIVNEYDGMESLQFLDETNWITP